MPTQTTLSISLIDSKTKGVPTAVFRRADGLEYYLHSRYDPLEEARFLVKDVPRQERTLYVVLGFGLGYHVKELLQRVPQSSHIIVMEPSSACLSGWLLARRGHQAWAWMHNHRLHFLAHHDPKVVPLSLTDRLASLRLLSLQLFTHLPSTLTAESFYQALLGEIPLSFPTSFQSRLNSLDKLLENHLQNFWANLAHSWNAVPVQSLRGKWSGRPVIIVSAGPSLTEALPILPEAKGAALLLATGSAVRILMARQIQPDLVVSLDPYEANLAHFQGWPTADIPLIYHPQIRRGILASYAGPRFFFVMKDDPPIPLNKSQEKCDFRQGGSVAFSALQLAHYLDANPIVFVGQDFAFAGTHTHAAGSTVNGILDIHALPKDCFMVPGVDGNPVVTSQTYYSYLLYMQDYLLDFAKRDPTVKHINTSRTGARIQGMEYVALERALADRQTDRRPSPRETITSAVQQNHPIPRDSRKAAVDRWIAELDRLLAPAAQIEDFERLFGKFRATSFYAQAARCYDDVYYLYETRYRGVKSPTPPSFPDRFKEHLQLVRETLHRIKKDLPISSQMGGHLIQ